MAQLAHMPVAATTRVLIVEDDNRYARLVSELLRTHDDGFDVIHASRLDAACEIVAQQTIDLVLLDIGLPDGNDLDGLTRLQNCVNEIPIIMLTGRADERLALEALGRGAEDYLVKDAIDFTTLIRSIRYAIERHRGIRDLARVTKELQLANSALEKLTLLDPLTELLNRRGFQQVLSREIEALQRDNTTVLVLLVDIDDFKRINDNLGHAVGDVALHEIAHRLRGCVRAVDYVARVGGDEFILLLPNADPTEAVRIAERARVAIATTTIQHTTGAVQLTASIAAMLLHPDTPSIEELMAKAHQLLRRSKTEGKNRIAYARQDFEDTGRRERHQSDMVAQLAQGQHLLTVQQPIFRLADEQPVACEFLSRYFNEQIEMPDNFFRVCSERNILTVVDHHCLRHAVRRSMTLDAFGRFHINLFPSTLINIPPEHLIASFPDPLPRDRYCIEISEQQIIGDPSYLQEPVRALRKAGLLIAIDDVGYGNSCVESLVLLEPDIIKIDKRCVTGVGSDPVRLATLQRYLGLAQTLGAEVVVEGIEERADVAVLRNVGVEYGQGYLWGQPA
jgi:diguanylate cyclase (GGDEF)-like protein